jgi:hypothetical protein
LIDCVIIVVGLLSLYETNTLHNIRHDLRRLRKPR